MARNVPIDSVQVTEAIYANGALKPLELLQLRENERVRVFVEAITEHSQTDREAAFIELVAGIERMNFQSTGPYPARDKLHERR